MLLCFFDVPRINIEADRVFLHVPEQQTRTTTDIKHDGSLSVPPYETGEYSLPVTVKDRLNTGQMISSHYPVIPLDVDVVLFDFLTLRAEPLGLTVIHDLLTGLIAATIRQPNASSDVIDGGNA
jgi:hypothetical protein